MSDVRTEENKVYKVFVYKELFNFQLCTSCVVRLFLSYSDDVSNAALRLLKTQHNPAEYGCIPAHTSAESCKDIIYGNPYKKGFRFCDNTPN